jgi:hypothetical protein
LLPFDPTNDLEVDLQGVQAGTIPLSACLRRLWSADLFVPSSEEIKLDGQKFRPVLVPREGVQMVAVFTSIERAAGLHQVAPHCLKIAAREFLPQTPPIFGIAINPGLPVGLELSPADLQQMIKEFSALH